MIFLVIYPVRCSTVYDIPDSNCLHQVDFKDNGHIVDDVGGSRAGYSFSSDVSNA
jgi:hypothetical protein